MANIDQIKPVSPTWPKRRIENVDKDRRPVEQPVPGENNPRNSDDDDDQQTHIDEYA